MEIIIHQTHYEKSDWSRAFNQFSIACELDMINAIRLCHTAAILSRETKKALFYHAEPRSQNRGARLSVVKQSFFGLPGQYGRRVTKANICCRYCINHVKFNVCLVTKPVGVFSSETKWLNASLLFLRMNYVKNASRVEVILTINVENCKNL